MADFRDSLNRVRLNVNGRTVELIGASFRGVPFCVETVELSTGRRLVVHEFPLRDDPFVEDIGRRARKFKVEAYVIGDDYVAQRDALLDALETEGPGALVLPSYPSKRAIGDATNVRETRSDGGYAVVSIEFVETPAQSPTPAIIDDAAGKVSAAADAAHVSVKAELIEKMDTASMPAFALKSAEDAVISAAAAIGAKLAPAAQAAAEVAGVTAEFAGAVTQDIAALNGHIHILTAQAATLVKQPGDLVDGFRAAIDDVDNSAEAAPGAIMNALREAYAADLGAPVAATTSTRERELANQVALTGALRRVIAIEAARLAPLVPYASIEDATAARDAAAALLDEQALGAGDTAYPGLVALRTQLLRAVPGSTVFPRVVAVSRRTPVPSLVLAYQLYGSVAQEQDVIARNRVSHPGFIHGALKVLSNGG